MSPPNLPDWSYVKQKGLRIWRSFHHLAAWAPLVSWAAYTGKWCSNMPKWKIQTPQLSKRAVLCNITHRGNRKWRVESPTTHTCRPLNPDFNCTACFKDSNSFQEGLVMIVLQVNYTLGKKANHQQDRPILLNHLDSSSAGSQQLPPSSGITSWNSNQRQMHQDPSKYSTKYHCKSSGASSTQDRSNMSRPLNPFKTSNLLSLLLLTPKHFAETIVSPSDPKTWFSPFLLARPALGTPAPLLPGHLQ